MKLCYNIHIHKFISFPTIRMANRQTYVAGALGVLIGMVVGANSAQRAESVSFSGSNPNTEAVQELNAEHRAAGILRQRSTETEARITDSVPPSVTSSVARRREMRLGDIFYFSAPSWTVRGMEAPAQPRVRECAGLSSKRYIRCLEAIITGDGGNYETNYFETNYDN